MSEIEEKQKQRFLFLDKLHSEVNGNENSTKDMYKIGKLIDFDRNKVINIVQYLESEGLVRSKAYGGTISGLVAITHKGIIEVDQAHNNPNSPTTNFPPNIIFVAGDYIRTGNKKDISISGVSGDVFGVDVSGDSNVVGKNIVVRDGTINVSEHRLTEIQNNEYAESLKKLSENINNQLKGLQISEEQIKSLNESINELAKEVKDIKPGQEEQIDYVKQVKIESNTVSVVQKILNVLPEAAETAATFTPLAPFSKLIGKGVTQIVDAITKRKKL